MRNPVVLQVQVILGLLLYLISEEVVRHELHAEPRPVAHHDRRAGAAVLHTGPETPVRCGARHSNIVQRALPVPGVVDHHVVVAAVLASLQDEAVAGELHRVVVRHLDVVGTFLR